MSFQQKLIDSKLYELLGEKTEADNEKPVKKKKEKVVKEKVEEEKTAIEEEINPYLIFPAPEENYKVVLTLFTLAFLNVCIMF